eukprot:gene7154-9159_t
MNAVNTGLGGIHSMAFAAEDSDRTRSLNFQPGDVLFIDFSVNDYQMDIRGRFCYGSEEALTEGVEVLIRKLLTLAPNSTIVLLEFQRLGRNEDDNREEPVYDPSLPPEINGLYARNKYLNAYRNISRHYQIPLWSYPDAFFGAYSYSHQPKTGPVARFEMNLPHDRWHPPWYVHLLYADLVGANLNLLYNSCTSSVLPLVERPNKEGEEMDTIHIAAPLLPATGSSPLPPPLMVNTKLHEPHCRPGSNHSITFSALNHIKSFRKSKSPPVLAGVSFTPRWTYTLEKNDKAGWISLYPRDPPTVPASTAAQSIGLPPSAESSDLYANNSITLSLALGEGAGPAPFQDVHIRIQYLRTYRNAGVADVYLCGKYFGTIDGMWESP